MEFRPDYRHFVDVMANRRPARLPLYEHNVNASSMEKILDVRFADLEHGDARDQAEYFRQHCRFFQTMTYDTVSYEVCIGATLPGRMAICGGQGPIQSRSDFNAYPCPGFRELHSRLCPDRQLPRHDPGGTGFAAGGSHLTARRP
jgi:uroporphyrinogen decarboxylase